MILKWIYLRGLRIRMGWRVIIPLLSLVILAWSCKKYPWDKCDIGEGDSFEEVRYFPNFHTFQLDIPAQIELIPDTNLTSSRIVVLGQKNVIKEIETVSNNGTVSVSFNKCFKSHSDIKFQIYTPWLREITLNSASRLQTKSAIYGSKFQLQVNSGTAVLAGFNVDTLVSNLRSAGTVELHGYAKKHFLTHSSNMVYKTLELITDSTVIEMESSGFAQVYVTGHMHANFLRRGILEFSGEDTLHIDTTNSGGAIIRDLR